MVGDQYPDILTFESELGEVKNIPCRFRPIKGNVFHRLKDGTDVQCSFDIAFPFGTESILIGTVVNGINERGETFLYQQQILAFHVGAYHCLGRV